MDAKAPRDQKPGLILGRSSDPDRLSVEALGQSRDDDPDALDVLFEIRAGAFQGGWAATIRRPELERFRRACEDIDAANAGHAQMATEEQELTVVIDVTRFGALRVSGSVRET